MPHGHGPQAELGVNQVYTKFLFVTLAEDDEATRTRVRSAGSAIARGFFNEFDANGNGREAQTLETIQFLVSDRTRYCADRLLSASHVAQVNAKYRPRLEEVERDLVRRLGDLATVRTLDGAVRTPRYTSAEMHEFAYAHAVPRTSGRIMTNAIIIPMSKTDEWWGLPVLERHAFFYPHTDGATGRAVQGHARAAEAGIKTIYRRLYHNPDGCQRPKEYDFVTYFACRDEHLPTFDNIRTALRNESQNPEWRYVIEGPEWRGRRVLKW